MKNYKELLINFFESINFDFNNIELQIIKSGRNNKVFKANINNENFLIKFYPNEGIDNKFRLLREINFLKHLEKISISSTPKVLFFSEQQNLGIFEYISGTKFKECNLNRERVIECANFFNNINSNSLRLKNDLLEASESFIDPYLFIKDIDNRIKKLLEFSEGDKNFQSFFNHLNASWKKIKKNIKSYKFLEHSKNNLCVSPSDFGFHNCIVNKNDELIFIDFEYSGVDDPVKFICDFFSQPDIPVPLEYLDEFSNIALKYSNQKDFLIERAKILLPIFQIKWCCIIMNLFIPEVQERRIFSDPNFELDLSKRIQLDKANKLISKINYV